MFDLLKPVFLSFLIGPIGAFFAWILNFPLPYLLGPVILSTFVALFGITFFVPNPIRQFSFICIGLSVGSNVTPEALSHAARWPVSLIMMIAAILIITLVCKVVLNKFFTPQAKRIASVSPLIAVLIIALIVGSIIGSGKEKIIQSGMSLIGAVVILHICGFFFGYVGAKILTKNEQVARTVSIEVGMQNSGLGAVLARQNIPHPAAAIPSAISALTHCMIGSLCAYIWGKER